MGPLSPVEYCVEGFPQGAFAAREGGGPEELLPASWGVFRVYLRGVGLGPNEDSVCPVEDPLLGVRPFSPGKLHPLLEGKDLKNDRAKNYFFLDICSTHDPDTSNKVQFYPICCFFPLFVY